MCVDPPHGLSHATMCVDPSPHAWMSHGWLCLTCPACPACSASPRLIGACDPIRCCARSMHVHALVAGSVSPQLCMPLTVCGEGEFESAAPTATSDRICKVPQLRYYFDITFEPSRTNFSAPCPHPPPPRAPPDLPITRYKRVSITSIDHRDHRVRGTRAKRTTESTGGRVVGMHAGAVAVLCRCLTIWCPQTEWCWCDFLVVPTGGGILRVILRWWMARWHGGTVVRWYGGWYSGTVGGMVVRWYGLVSWCGGTGAVDPTTALTVLL